MASDSRFRFLPALFACLFVAAALSVARAAETSRPLDDKSAAPAPSVRDRHSAGKGGRSSRPEEDPRDREQREAAEHMRHLLSMSDAQIGRMRGVLDALEKIPVGKRAELRRRLEALRRATPAERDAFLKELHDKYGIFEEPRNKPREGGVRNLLEKHFSSFPTPEAADAERKRFLAMSREEKIAYIRTVREKYGLSATPKSGGESAPKPPPPDGAPTAQVAPKPPPDDPFGA